MVTIEGNGTIETIFVFKYLNGNIRGPQMVINYNFIKGVTNEEEKIMFFFEPNLFSIEMINFPDQAIFEPHIQFHHEPRTIVVDGTLAMEKVKNLKIAKWILSQNIQV
jgi:hypothetical protein